MADEKRLIDANALKSKLQDHKDFFVDAWRGFSEMTYATKCRVDEIDNCIAEIVNAPTVDAVEVVRCNDCKHFKPAHFKADDGTETPWDETFSFDVRSDGIYHGGKCKHDRNTSYGQKDMAFRKPTDFCSYGERKDNA